MKLQDKIFLSVAILIGVLMLYVLAPIIMPFFIAFVLAYISNPFVQKLMRHNVPRAVAIAIVLLTLFIGVFSLVIILIPIIHKQISTLTIQLPNIVAWIQNKTLPWINKYLAIQEIDSKTIRNFITQRAMNTQGAISWLLHSGQAVVETMLYLILIPVVSCYFLKDWNTIFPKLNEIIPSSMRASTANFLKECDFVLSGFFRGQLLIMLFLAGFYSISLSIVGLQLGIVIGVIIGLTSIVPYLGLLLGLAIATISALVEYGDLTTVLWVSGVFIIGHSIENFYLTPKLIGNRIGLHPVVVIFAILAGGSLFGFFGVLLALPCAAVLMVLSKHIYQHYVQI